MPWRVVIRRVPLPQPSSASSSITRYCSAVSTPPGMLARTMQMWSRSELAAWAARPALVAIVLLVDAVELEQGGWRRRRTARRRRRAPRRGCPRRWRLASFSASLAEGAVVPDILSTTLIGIRGRSHLVRQTGRPLYNSGAGQRRLAPEGPPRTPTPGGGDVVPADAWGFLKHPRMDAPKRPVPERLQDWRVVLTPRRPPRCASRPRAAWTAASPSATRAARSGTSSPTGTSWSPPTTGGPPSSASTPPTTSPSSPAGCARPRASRPACWRSTTIR